LLQAHPGAEIGLRKSGGGVFEIVVDGRLAYSKKATGRFPTEAEVLGSV
jgi:selT/selW/selH-like putative selenoprotein